MSERKTTKKKAVKRMAVKKGEETIEEKENELIKQSRAVAEEARKAAEEYVTPDGRAYILTPINRWTFFQTAGATALVEKVQNDPDFKAMKEAYQSKEGGLSVTDILDYLFRDKENWGEFFHLIYVPKEKGCYDEDHKDNGSEQAKKDMLLLNIGQATGAVFHFFICSVEFIPPPILSFLMSLPGMSGFLGLLKVVSAGSESKKMKD